MSADGKKKNCACFFLFKRNKICFQMLQNFCSILICKATSKRLGFQANSPTNWCQRVHLPHENWKFGGEMKTINCDLYLLPNECYGR